MHVTRGIVVAYGNNARWNVEHDGQVLSIHRSRKEARKAIKARKSKAEPLRSPQTDCSDPSQEQS
jgi:hypothetical protein